MHPEITHVLGKNTRNPSKKQHENTQNNSKNNSQHEYSLASDSCKKCLNYSRKMLLNSSKRVNNHPRINEDPDKIDEIELIFST